MLSKYTLMKKTVTLIPTLLLLFIMQKNAFSSTPGVGNLQSIDDLKVTEIFYAETNAGDQLQFIEVFNMGANIIQLSDFQIEGLPVAYGGSVVLQPEESAIFCKDAALIRSTFNIESNAQIFEWTSGSLNFTGQTIRFVDVAGNFVKEVSYSNAAPYPVLPTDVYTSIVLCDPNGNQNDASNWQVANWTSGNVIDSRLVYGDPHELSYCAYPIAAIRPVDNDGRSLLLNRRVMIAGTVYGINARTTGLQYTIIDDDGNGYGIFSSVETFGYTVSEGDRIRVRGIVSQFNGLGQLSPLRSIDLIGSNQSLLTPVIVDNLDEESESRLIKLENVTLVNPSQWTNTGTGFNVNITNGIDIFEMRILRNSDIFGRNAPIGTFDVAGIGSQFDNMAPFTSGYQIIPRYIADFDPFNDTDPNEYPKRTIPQVTTVDAEGVADSLGIKCELEGIVYGVNIRPQGLQFTIIDEGNNGIGVFRNTGNLNYTVQEGDRISIKGEIDQFNGLTQILPDFITLMSSDNPLVQAKVVTLFEENDESSLIKIENLNYVDRNQWLGNGGSFNVTFTNGTTEFVVRIDNDVDLSNMPPPMAPMNITGILGQFDNTRPFNTGYQLFPRYKEDIESITSTKDVGEGYLKIIPNPVSEWLEISSVVKTGTLEVSDLNGKILKSFKNFDNKYFVGDLPAGIYIALFKDGNQTITSKFVKI